MTQRVEWEVLKSSGRWRGARATPLEVGARLAGESPGETFRARQEDLLLRVVPGTAAAWRPRADNLVKLGHPNLLGIVGIGRLDDRVVLVEDLPPHPDLRAFIRPAAPGGGVSLPEVSKLFSEVLGALRHVHGAQLTHGGLSAGCVSVGRDGVGGLDVRLSGAGVLSGLREDGESVPPELWDSLAPELVESTTRATVASDLFGAGVLLMHALTGDLHVPGSRAPWREFSADSEALRRAIRSAREDLPDSLVDLIAGLLAARPEDRQPKTVQELLRRIQKERWEPREVPARPSKPTRATLQLASEEGPRERPVMIVTSRPVPRVAEAVSAPPTSPAEVTSAESPATAETSVPPAKADGEFADDTLPVGAPPIHEVPKPIDAAPPAATLADDTLPIGAPPIHEVPKPIDAGPSPEAPSAEELVSTLPLTAASVRSVIADEPEATLPIGVSSSSFTKAPAGEPEGAAQGGSSPQHAPRSIPRTQLIAAPGRSNARGPDLFANESAPVGYDDSDVATDVKVSRPAHPQVIQPSIALVPPPALQGRPAEYEVSSPTVKIPGLALRTDSSAPTTADAESSGGLPLTVKIAALVTVALVIAAVFVMLAR